MSENLGAESQEVLAHPKKKKIRKFIAISLGAVLLSVGIAAVAIALLVGRGPQPEDVLPSDTVAIAKVDLNPKIGQRINLVRFLSKFPQALQNFDEEDPIGSVIRQFGLDSEIDWDSIKPWIGNRYAVAAIESAGSLNAVLLLSVNEESQATYFMAKNFPESNYKIIEKFLVIAQTKSVLNLVSSAPNKLADSQVYKDDIDSLGDDHVALIWADLKPISRLARNEIGDFLLDQGLDSGLYKPESAQGRIVMGMRFTPSTFETNILALGLYPDAKSSPSSGTASEAIGKLPFTTLGAAAIEGIGDFLAENVLTNDVVKDALDSINVSSREVRDLFAGPIVLFALKGDTIGADPNYFIRLTPESINVTVASIRRLLRENGVDPQELDSLTRIEGESLYFGANKEVLDNAISQLRASANTLSSLDSFKQIVRENSDFAAFVNLEDVVPISGIDTKGAPLRALGISANTSREGNEAIRASIILSLKP